MKPKNAKSNKQLAEIARLLQWGLLFALTLTSYVAETRPIVSSSFGWYNTGLLDGFILTTLILVGGFYAASKIKQIR